MITPDVARAAPTRQPAKPSAAPAPDEAVGETAASFSDLVEEAKGGKAASVSDPADPAEPAEAAEGTPDAPPVPQAPLVALAPEPGAAAPAASIEGVAPAPAAPPGATAPAATPGALAVPPAGTAEAEPAAADPAAEGEASADAADPAAPTRPASAETRPAASLPLNDAPRADAPGWRLAAVEGHAPLHRAHGPAAVAAPPREVAAQITLAVGQASEGQVEIRLDPPELGRVQIRLHAGEGGAIQAIVLADRPETQDFLRRHAETLARDLSEAGYSQVSLEFAAGDDASRREAGAGGFAPGDADAEAGSTAVAAYALPAAAGLDIRL